MRSFFWSLFWSSWPPQLHCTWGVNFDLPFCCTVGGWTKTTSAVNLCCKTDSGLSCSDFSSFFAVSWQYIHTECAEGWWPHNGFCYRLLSETEAGSWEESSRACSSHGANLISVHSLSEVEMLLNLLANCKGHRANQKHKVLFVVDTLNTDLFLWIQWWLQFLGRAWRCGLVFGNRHRRRL